MKGLTDVARPLPAPCHGPCPETVTPALAPCLAQTTLASPSLSGTPALHTHPSTPLCLSLSPPPPPRGLLPLTHRPHCPRPLFRLGGAADGNNRGRLHRVGPTELIRGTGVPQPQPSASSPASSLPESGVGRAGRGSCFCERTQAPGMPRNPSSRGPSQAGRGGSCVNLPRRPPLSQPCHVTRARKALGRKHHPLVPLGQPGISGALARAA